MDKLLRARVQKFAELQNGWCDGDGASISPESITQAIAVLDLVLDDGEPEPPTFPTLEGFVQVEWPSGVTVVFYGDSLEAWRVMEEEGQNRARVGLECSGSADWCAQCLKAALWG